MKVLLYQFHLLKDTGLTFTMSDDGDFGEYWKLSSKSCKKYADRFGWDYILDSPSEDSWIPFFLPEPQFEQFRAIEFLKDYDAVIFVDTDILIKPNSPNIVNIYESNGTPIVINTAIGNNLSGDLGGAIGVNSGVVIWYNKSKFTNNLYELKPIDYGWVNNNTFFLGEFIKERQNLKWWERWEDFIPFIGQFRSGYYNDDKFLGFIISVFSLPISHLAAKYNYRIRNKKDANKILDDDIHFIHYVGNSKQFMKKHYEVIF